MNVIFLAYRDWAINVFPVVQKHPKIGRCVLCTTHDELINLNLSDFSLLITCGWSEELGDEVASRIPAIGVHCAELDRYSYGSPLQNQIIDGLRFTKHRVFKFTYDKGSSRAHTHSREYSHEVDLDLSGNMEDILYQMTATSIILFNMFLDDYPEIVWKQWPAETAVRQKRVPTDSRLTKEDLLSMSTEDIYNFFRCLEDPYPNGFIEDEKGFLYIKRVAFKKK
ncbi:MAG: hypothetical protein EPN22_13370 [Nitrospirae bacterium]|nr:MAG: hypothetical protein EPN22_13370 [Nitrospirota bacterium]